MTHDRQLAAHSRALSLSLGRTSNVPLHSEVGPVWASSGLGVGEGTGKAYAEDDRPAQVKRTAPRLFVAGGP